MAFYVPLGPRGLLFRLGTFVIGVWGGLVYRLAYQRRMIIVSHPAVFPTRRYEFEGAQSLEVAPSLPDVLVQRTVLSESEAAALLESQALRNCSCKCLLLVIAA